MNRVSPFSIERDNIMWKYLKNTSFYLVIALCSYNNLFAAGAGMPEQVKAQWLDKQSADQIADYIFNNSEIKQKLVEHEVITADSANSQTLSSFLQSGNGGLDINNYNHITQLSEVLRGHSPEYAKTVHKLGLKVLSHSPMLVDIMVVHPWFVTKYGVSIPDWRQILSGDSLNLYVDRKFIKEILIQFIGYFDLYKGNNNEVKLKIPGVHDPEIMTRDIIELLRSALEYYQDVL